jgi:hypothetical protein
LAIFLADVAERKTTRFSSVRALCTFVFYGGLQEASTKIRTVLLLQVLAELLTWKGLYQKHIGQNTDWVPFVFLKGFVQLALGCWPLNTFEEVFRAADMSFERVAIVSLRGVGYYILCQIDRLFSCLGDVLGVVGVEV